MAVTPGSGSRSDSSVGGLTAIGCVDGDGRPLASAAAGSARAGGIGFLLRHGCRDSLCYRRQLALPVWHVKVLSEGYGCDLAALALSSQKSL